MKAKERSSQVFWQRLTIAVLCVAILFGGYFLYRLIGSTKGEELSVPIRAIVQTGPQKEALKTAYLAELLELSVDHPLLSSEFDKKKGEDKLLASPVIKGAVIKIHEPGILYIDYMTRQPAALFADYENIALDIEGYPFPITPFFSPKNLPEIYMDLDEKIEFNRPLEGKKKDLAFHLLDLVCGPVISDFFNVKRIDVSKAFEATYGRREIVLKTEDRLILRGAEGEVHFTLPRLLRLSTKNYSQDLANYLKLREKILEKERRTLQLPGDGRTFVTCNQKIIDFRVPQLAFIDDGEF